jgi:hypothetical protein
MTSRPAAETPFEIALVLVLRFLLGTGKAFSFEFFPVLFLLPAKVLHRWGVGDGAPAVLALLRFFFRSIGLDHNRLLLLFRLFCYNTCYCSAISILSRPTERLLLFLARFLA